MTTDTAIQLKLGEKVQSHSAFRPKKLLLMA